MRWLVSGFILKFRLSHLFESTVVTSNDILDILDTWTITDLDDVYVRLGLSDTDIANAKLEGHDPREKVKKVFHLWCGKDAEGATRKVLFAAMNRCGRSRKSMNDLKKLWQGSPTCDPISRY